MKITQLLNGTYISLTNQEREFVDSHGDKVKLTGLSEQETWLARNLVRKGIYSISKDNKTLIKQLNESHYR